MSAFAPTTLHEVRKAIETSRSFHSRPLRLKGDYIAVLSSHLIPIYDDTKPATYSPVGYRTGATLPNDKNDPTQYSKVAPRHSTKTTPAHALNDKVNRDATARAVRYMTRDTTQVTNPRQALHNETVYYVTRLDTGAVVGLITAGGTVHVMPGRDAFRSDQSMRTVIDALHTARTTLAYKHHTN